MLETVTELLTRLEHLHSGRLLFHPEDDNRLDHRVAVKRSLVTAATATQQQKLTGELSFHGFKDRRKSQPRERAWFNDPCVIVL